MQDISDLRQLLQQNKAGSWLIPQAGENFLHINRTVIEKVTKKYSFRVQKGNESFKLKVIF